MPLHHVPHFPKPARSLCHHTFGSAAHCLLFYYFVTSPDFCFAPSNCGTGTESTGGAALPGALPEGVGTGEVSLIASMTPVDSLIRCVARYARLRLVTKNTKANIAVARDRKFAEPLDPKRLPEEPLPNAAPMSAPLPCWSKTNPMMPNAAITWTIRIKVNQIFMPLPFFAPRQRRCKSP